MKKVKLARGLNINVNGSEIANIWAKQDKWRYTFSFKVCLLFIGVTVLALAGIYGYLWVAVMGWTF